MRDVDEALDAAEVESATRRALALALYVLMGEISEDYYCAGWMSGLEYRLWRRVVDEQDDGDYGMGVITDSQKGALTELAGLCGGWWAWRDDGQGPRFVPLAAWKVEYAARLGTEAA